ncbi:MAG: hypothetical protein ACLTYN_05020 [Dysosmobacter welbionis]
MTEETWSADFSAIDLRGDRCPPYQGDYDKETVYEPAPWPDFMPPAPDTHVVDLDERQDGTANFDTTSPPLPDRVRLMSGRRNPGRGRIRRYLIWVWTDP